MESLPQIRSGIVSWNFEIVSLNKSVGNFFRIHMESVKNRT